MSTLLAVYGDTMDANEAMDALDAQVSKLIASFGCDLVPVIDLDSSQFFLCARLGDGTLIPVKTPVNIYVAYEQSDVFFGYEQKYKITATLRDQPDHWFSAADEAREMYHMINGKKSGS